jgi:D-glycero-D-manno-heptose 1,7-bisphosphate phosphatase
MNTNKPIPVIFLDRDGVINHDPGDYTKHLSEFTILPGVIEQLKVWTKEGYFVIVITNQGGIAKKKYSLSDFYEIDAYMSTKFLENNIAYLDTYFCTHHDSVSKCLCRKPLSGMIEKAIYQHNVDTAKSVMIGDKMRDVECSENAGVRGIKIGVNQDLRTVRL